MYGYMIRPIAVSAFPFTRIVLFPADSVATL
jgi:hypothetical protein